jgi:large subunit ribosomal protein L19e
MNLGNKKELAARTLGIGKERIIFLESKREEIKQALTKQDIKDLIKVGSIIIKEPKGRKTIVKRKNRRGPGKIKKKVNTRKQDYVIMTRKLRKYLNAVSETLGITSLEKKEVRKKIRNKQFKSKANFKEFLGGIRK